MNALHRILIALPAAFAILVLPVQSSPGQAAVVRVLDATATAGALVEVGIAADTGLGRLGSIDVALRYDPAMLKAHGATGRFATAYHAIDADAGVLRTLQSIPRGADIQAGETLLTVRFEAAASIPAGASAPVEILPETGGGNDFLTPLSPLNAGRLPVETIAGAVYFEGNRRPGVFVAPLARRVMVGELAVFTVEAEDPDGSVLTFSAEPADIGVFSSVNRVGNRHTATFNVLAFAENAGENRIVLRVTDTGEPSFTVSETIVVQVVDPSRMDELAIAQGHGGGTETNLRTFDPGAGGVNTVLRSMRAAGGRFLESIGGGTGRATHVSMGDVNNDGRPDLVLSLGPVTAEARFPNIVVPRGAVTRGVIGHSFNAFPPGVGSPVNYNGGEVWTAVGDFIGSGTPQIAAAQGYGGNGVVRLFQYTGRPAPNGWDVVGQFSAFPLSVQAANANGGVTLAAADIDLDGLDELLAGQTNSPTSQTIFHILDISPEGDIAARTPYAGFQSRFRGNGGVALAAADLNGDGRKEIVAASLGNGRGHGDERDNTVLNLISVMTPVVENRTVIGVLRAGRGVANVLPEDANPSGALSIAAGEFNGNPLDGEEIVIGTGSLSNVDGFDIVPILPAPVPAFRIVKILFDGETVGGIEPVLGPPQGTPAFAGAFAPASGAVFLSAGDIQ